MKICLTTFVQGHLYQEYLPMLIYSIGKAYPEYDVKIFCTILYVTICGRH